MGFNALIHSHRPDLFDFAQLTPGRNIDNLNHAFNVANDDLGINKYVLNGSSSCNMIINTYSIFSIDYLTLKILIPNGLTRSRF